ncbi:MAG TPA: diaminopimelate decarboxylase [Acidimicrobiia bacterium]|nr:diaminopimelate decarboxylase [Acidimicrobiia bacterium]
MTALPWSLLPDGASEGDDGELWIGGRSTLELAAQFGTPLFVYDEAHLRARCQQAKDLFGEGAVYAAKAFLCKAMAQLVHEEGLRMDVATGGELFVALAAGVPGGRLVMHGNNKSEAELEEAIGSGIGRLVVDNFDELDRLEKLHQRTGRVLDVLLRVTPGVEAHTHHYIATGQDDTKFGFTLSTGAASAAVTRARSMESIRIRGIHLHIGSQVFLVDSFAAALGVVASFVKNHDLEELSMGGGLGVAYVAGEHAPSMADWALMLKTAAKDAGIEASLSVEPGRAIAAQAAITLYTVGTIKEIPGVRTYVAVDGGMSDNPRPVLYGSGYETFLPRAVAADRPRSVRLVGKHCESGDVLVMNGSVPDDLAVGDILATPVTGAYGHSMGSNYNKVGRPAVVFVKDGDARLVVRRETYEDLVRNDLPL